MNPLLIAIPVFMATIVGEAWLARRRGAALYDLADAVTSLHLGIVQQLAGVLLAGWLWVGLYVETYRALRLLTLDASSPWVWLAALLAYDFCAYWAHRLDHEVNLLWAAHVVHHSSEYYNLSTALRQSGTTVVLHGVFYLPLALAGVPPLVFFSVSLAHLLYQYWVHTELIGRLGWLDGVLVTPSNHRVHHGQNDYCIDRNYGGLLILWDRLFGTFAAEREGERIVYGVRKPLRSCNPLWATVHHYVDLWRQTGRRTGWRAKLRLWFESPSGPSGVPAPFDAVSFVRYAPAPARNVGRYVLLQYALTVPAVMHLLAIAPRLDPLAKLAYVLVIVATVQSLGALLQGLPAARRLEAARVAVAALLVAGLVDGLGPLLTPALRVTALAVGAASALWLLGSPAPAAARAGEPG